MILKMLNSKLKVLGWKMLYCVKLKQGECHIYAYNISDIVTSPILWKRVEQQLLQVLK